MRDKVTICVIFYNNRDLVGRCLSNIVEEVMPEIDCDVMALDNGSTDDTYEQIGKYGSVKAFRLEENRFFSGGANYLLDRCESKHVIFMNSDAFPEREAIPAMLQFARDNEKVGIIGCSSILPSGEVEGTAKKYLSPYMLHLKYGIGGPLAPLINKSFFEWYLYKKEGFPFGRPRKVDIVQDSFVYIKGELLRKGLRYDEALRLYFTEDDICWQAQQMGYQVYFLPDAKTGHLLQATLDQKEPSVWKIFQEDCVAYCKKHYGWHGDFLERSIKVKRTIKSFLNK